MKPAHVLKLSSAVLIAGVLFGLGQRIGQWLLPPPDTRILVCSPEEAETLEVCAGLDQLSPETPTDTDEVLPPPTGQRV